MNKPKPKPTRIMNLYDEHMDSINDICRGISLPVPTLLAILQVETNDDDGFNAEGRLIIRFEIHKFMQYCPISIISKYSSQFSFNPTKPWKDHKFRIKNEDKYNSFHGNQKNEYFVFNECVGMDSRAAHMSISMGLGQIMGFNYLRAGFSTPEAMYWDFNTGTINQIDGMVRFLSRPMLRSLRNRDFVEFARVYNGVGKARRYGDMIKVAESEIAAWLD